MTTSKPRIAYVDEQADERVNFETDAHLSELFGEVISVQPTEDLSDLIDGLIDLKIDALVTDFRLTQAGPLGYSGEDIVNAFQKVREGFPCFIRTSFEDDALSSAADVNKVYSKEHQAADEHGSLFVRIVKQVERYRATLDRAQEELAELLRIPAAERTASDVDRLVELDSFIENALGADTGIPKSVKEILFEGRDQLLEETHKLIVEIKAELQGEHE